MITTIHPSIQPEEYADAKRPEVLLCMIYLIVPRNSPL